MFVFWWYWLLFLLSHLWFYLFESFLFFLISVVRGLSILFMFSKIQLLVTLICSIVFFFFKDSVSWGAWVAQLVKHPTSAQVVISQFMGLSPESGSVLMAQSLELTSDSVSPSLSAPPLPIPCQSLSLKNKYMLKKIKK